MTVTRQLWDLVFQPIQVDPEELARAIEHEVQHEPLDFRTRLLIRDGINALFHHWGAPRTSSWLRSSRLHRQLEEIWQSDDFREPGFALLAGRVMEPTKRQDVLEFLRELSVELSQPQKLIIGGSIALILAGHLSRHTEDIDVVDEVPEAIRSQIDLLDRLMSRYGLRLAHFQSHYLPAGWEKRVRSLGQIGALDLFVVDEMDVAVSKLFSPRERDRDDLRVLARILDRDQLTGRIKSSAEKFLLDPSLRPHAERNWFILFGESLPA